MPILLQIYDNIYLRLVCFVNFVFIKQQKSQLTLIFSVEIKFLVIDLDLTLGIKRE